MKKGLKLAVSGKGGVGKTTIASIICQLLQQEGKRVLAVDADPDANLGMALGFPADVLANAVTIAQDRKLIKEKTGAEPGSSGQWFMLNPTVDDIPQRYVVEYKGIQLLQMGAVASGGGGCACPESTLLKALLNHLIVAEQDAVIVDMEAGLEHLGRGTAESVDGLLIVMEPGMRSFTTAKSIIKLAKDLGVTNIFGIVNKMDSTTLAEIQQKVGDELLLVGGLPYSDQAVKCDFAGVNLFDACPNIVADVAKLLERVRSELSNS